jgi:hypothetical protein
MVRVWESMDGDDVEVPREFLQNWMRSLIRIAKDTRENMKREAGDENQPDAPVRANVRLSRRGRNASVVGEPERKQLCSPETEVQSHWAAGNG